MYALRRLEIPVNDFVLMEVVHAVGDLFGPVEHLIWPEGRSLLLRHVQIRVELTERTELHDDAEDLLAVERDALELHQIRVAEFLQMLDVRLLARPHLLDGHLLALERALEHAALCATRQPLQILQLVKGYLELATVATATSATRGLLVRRVAFEAIGD